MIRNIFLMLSLALVLHSSTAVSQTDDCRDVLVYSARTETIETLDYAAASKIYDQYCEESSVRSGTNFGAGIDAIVKAIPVKFALNSGSNEERLSSFCKTFSSDQATRTTQYKSQSLVVTDTTNAWLACKALAGQGVLFRPKLSTTKVVIEVARTNAYDVSVQGVSYDTKLLQCTVPSSDQAPDRRAAATPNTRKKLSPDYWSITCDRLPQSNGVEKQYPHVDITVDTTKGSFLLPVPAEAVLPLQASMDIQQKLEEFQRKLAELQRETQFKALAPVEIVENQVQKNDTIRPAFVTLFCNATTQGKQMEVFLGSSPNSLRLVSSESGGDRMAASAIVPPGWYYQVKSERVPGMGCAFLQWNL
jgi:hypothetical protein